MEDVLEEANNSNLNASNVVESGIIGTSREAHAQSWLKGNRLALLAHNDRVGKEGTLLIPDWRK